MRALGALALAVLVCGCAAPATRASSSSDADVASVTLWVTSWGRTLEKWTIRADGTASLESRPREMSLLEPLTPQSFTVTPAEFARVRAALAGAERYVGTNFSCSDAVTDAPSGRVIWTRADGQEVQADWYAGCLGRDRRRDAFLERVEEADAIVREIAGAP